MIFETDKFAFESNQTVKLVFSNDYSVVVKCSNDDCIITSGFDGNLNDIKHSSLEDAESVVVNLIQKNVKEHGAKLVSIARGKQKTSQYKSFMESTIKKEII